MKRLVRSIILAPVMIMFWSAPAYAKNKENCKAIGGKWLPGSTTNPERGACIFLNRQGSGGRDSPTKFAIDGTTTTETCKARGGELSRNNSECSISMNKPADSVKLNGN